MVAIRQSLLRFHFIVHVAVACNHAVAVAATYVGQKIIFASSHLPHAGASDTDYIKAVDEVQWTFREALFNGFDLRWKRSQTWLVPTFMATDTNLEISAQCRDGHHIGPSCAWRSQHSVAKPIREFALYELLVATNISLIYMFGVQRPTQVQWRTKRQRVSYYFAIFASDDATQVTEESLDFFALAEMMATDHFPMMINVVFPPALGTLRPSKDKRWLCAPLRFPKDWTPTSIAGHQRRFIKEKKKEKV